MDPNTPEGIAEEWIEKWSQDNIPAIGEGVSDSLLDWDLPRKNPELCLKSILEVLSQISAKPDNRYFQVLASGPLEDLIVENGERVIEQIESLCRQSPEFRLLLNGTWLYSAKKSVSERLEKYRDNRW